MVEVARLVQAFKVPINANKALLSSNWDVSDGVWKRIQDFSSEQPKDGKEAGRLLLKLFSLAKSAPQRALIGSLMLENGLRLPLKQDIRWIRSLMAAQQPFAALDAWRGRKDPPINSQTWIQLGVEALLTCHRVADAERLASRLTRLDRVAHLFLSEYSKQHSNSERMREWAASVAPSAISKSIIRLLKSGHVDLASELLRTADKETRDAAAASNTAIAAALLLNANDKQSVVRALASMPQLVNDVVFQQAWAKLAPLQLGTGQTHGNLAISEQVVRLLESGEETEAWKLADSNANMRLYQSMLRHAFRHKDKKLVERIFLHAKGHLSDGDPSQEHVQFILRCCLASGTWEQQHSILQAVAAQQAELDYSAWLAVWKTLRRFLARLETRGQLLPTNFVDMHALFQAMSRSPRCHYDITLIETIEAAFKLCGDKAGFEAATRLRTACITPDLKYEDKVLTSD